MIRVTKTGGSDIHFIMINYSLTGRFFSQLTGARAPLQAKIRDMEDDMQHLQDKLGKVKADNQKVTFCF